MGYSLNCNILSYIEPSGGIELSTYWLRNSFAPLSSTHHHTLPQLFQWDNGNWQLPTVANICGYLNASVPPVSHEIDPPRVGVPRVCLPSLYVWVCLREKFCVITVPSLYLNILLRPLLTWEISWLGMPQISRLSIPANRSKIAQPFPVQKPME